MIGKKIRTAIFVVITVAAFICALSLFEPDTFDDSLYTSRKVADTAAPAAAGIVVSSSPQSEAASPVEVSYSSSSGSFIDTSEISNGYIYVRYSGASVRHKLAVKYGSNTIYYNFTANGTRQKFYLTEGSGTYYIILYQNVGGSSYIVVASQSVSYTESSGGSIPGVSSKFLKPSNEINYDESPKSVAKAKTLVNSVSVVKSKVSKIYTYVVKSVRYNYAFLSKIPSGYLPDMDTTYVSKKGICYDFAALFGGMLRSQGIPAKLIKGTSTLVNGYHAWNEVYIGGKWYIVDASTDSILYANRRKLTMFKSSSQYSKQKES